MVSTADHLIVLNTDPPEIRALLDAAKRLQANIGDAVAEFEQPPEEDINAKLWREYEEQLSLDIAAQDTGPSSKSATMADGLPLAAIASALEAWRQAKIDAREANRKLTNITDAIARMVSLSPAPNQTVSIDLDDGNRLVVSRGESLSFDSDRLKDDLLPKGVMDDDVYEALRITASSARLRSNTALRTGLGKYLTVSPGTVSISVLVPEDE